MSIFNSIKERFLGCKDCRENLEELMLKLLAHEIRNPMAEIGGLANRLYVKYADENKEKNIDDNDVVKLGKIKKAADRICGITLIFDELIRTPVFRPRKENVDDVIGNVIKIELHDLVQFHWHSEHQEQPMIDPSRLSFALLNIIRNAIDAITEKNEKSKKGATAYKGEIRINTGNNLSKNIFFIEIRNNGIAIPEETVRDIFNPSFSTKGEGKGFGLTIAKDIVEKHGGSIRVESSSEETIFKIILPLFPAEPGPGGPGKKNLIDIPPVS